MRHRLHLTAMPTKLPYGLFADQQSSSRLVDEDHGLDYEVLPNPAGGLVDEYAVKL